MKAEIIKTAEVFRMPLFKDYLIDFIDHDLSEVLILLKRLGIIDGYYFTNRLNSDFLKGIDFYIFLGSVDLPVQITSDEENVDLFSERGILTIFLPEKDGKGRILSPDQRRVMVIGKIIEWRLG